jgi:PAS domain S-box-containing protein
MAATKEESAHARAEQELRDAKVQLQVNYADLQLQREWFAVTLSSISDAVITADARGIVTFLNPIAESMTGWTSQEARGQPLGAIFDLINDIKSGSAENPIETVLREARVVKLLDHSALIARRDLKASLEIVAAPIRDSKAAVVGAVMVFRDITARRQVEAALSESELQYRTVFNQAAVGIAVTDLHGGFLQVNKKFTELFGYTLEELRQRAFLQLTHADDVAEATEKMRPLTTGDISDLQLERRWVCKDGRTIWSLSTMTLVRDASGLPHHITAILEDITARKRAEEDQARLAAIITSSDDSIISMTLRGVITSWNHGAERMYGYRAPEMIGRTTSVLIPRDRSNEEALILERIRKGERIEHFETVRVRKDATKMDVSVAVSPIADVRGNIIGASKITRDITQSKRTEAALRETDRRKDEFLATLAHELRNPLAPIRQAALISKALTSTEAQKRWSHDVIERQVHHMSLLLNDLLDISRVSRGTLDLRLETTDLKDVVAAAVETARPVIDAKRHVFSVASPAESIQIVADPLRLAQILSNLLTNAAKYTDPEGQIQLRISRSEGGVTIAVSDSGIGIPTDAASHVFDMFSQVKSTQDRSEGGLGIGLALTKGLVELHRGRIEVRSAGLGLGSEFIVWLPDRRPQSIHVAAQTPAAAAQPASRRILIADDNRDAADSLGMLLSIAGHDVRVVHDGHAALAAFAEFRPEVALLDIGMPDISGYEVASSVRRKSLDHAVTLIAVTGWGQDRDKAQALAAGFNHHFTKPVDPDRISDILRSMDRR